LRTGKRYIILEEGLRVGTTVAAGCRAAICRVGIYTALQTRYMWAEELSGDFVIVANPEENGVSVEEKVIGIVSEQLQIPKEEIAADKSFVDDLKADSLDVVELVMEFEDVFKITIPDEDYEKIKTVGDAVKYIEEKQ
jgi:acyl carrier protein